MLAFRLYGYVDDPIGYILVTTGYPRMSYYRTFIRRQLGQDRLLIAIVTLVTTSISEHLFLFRRPTIGLIGKSRIDTGGEIRGQ